MFPVAGRFPAAPQSRAQSCERSPPKAAASVAAWICSGWAWMAGAVRPESPMSRAALRAAERGVVNMVSLFPPV